MRGFALWRIFAFCGDITKIPKAVAMQRLLNFLFAK